jgi:Methyltransferase domain
MIRFGRGAAMAALFGLGACAGAFFETSLDVPYVATPQPVVDEMLRLAQVTGQDYLIDLGSGDGRIVVTAARRFGTRGVGVDLDPRRIEESLENARDARVANKVQFHRQNIFETDLSPATVVTMFLLPTVNVELRPKLFAELRPGTRIVSHKWDMGEWQPDRTLTVSDEGASIYLWVIPANAGGRWSVRVPANDQAEADIRITQRYQFISAEMRIDGARLTADSARIRGDELELIFEDVRAGNERWKFAGRVQGNEIRGTLSRQAGVSVRDAPFRAVRTAS